MFGALDQLAMAIGVLGAGVSYYWATKLIGRDPNNNFPALAALVGGFFVYTIAYYLLLIALLYGAGWIIYTYREEIVHAINQYIESHNSIAVEDEPQDTMVESIVLVQQRHEDRVRAIKQLSLDPDTEEQAIENATVNYDLKIKELADEPY